MLPAMPPERALLANEDAWLKRSHREKATVLVIVRIRAMTATVGARQHNAFYLAKTTAVDSNLPTRLSQIIFCSLTTARIASPIHNAGVT